MADLQEKTKTSRSQPATAPQVEASSQSKLPLLISGLLVVGLVGCYFLVPSVREFLQEAWDVLTSDDRQRISSWVSQLGFWGPFAIVAAMVAQMFLLVIPSPLLMIVSVLAYGPWWGGLLCIAAVATAATFGYWLGRALGAHTVERLIGGKTEKKVEKYVGEYGFWAVIVARISPFLSNDAISFVAGLMGMGFWKFTGATLAGITPLTVLIAWLGADFNRLTTGLLWVSVASLVVLAGYIIYDRTHKSS
ncbi:Uncharacterized membrane protein YdjX, TVP38/TMEM64 family, SNARE-associated domain [Catalinimonas alkaloidigena]|uniref:TVP38/TMEM64 family membrane protein n=1 Tax=Catalinimonas alkaloidigena TaxID=1075417 RepID=A0A1G8XA55_9BACT|nr:TVP38/TMEM64 family protein [Catalinimonas alkaloidigena]SDJ87363.1 Uncharacterized membrane protein YdjX, TVP38/TMEM64 family, SNARE-associated domain [Catalinimonas alkaloidigena]